MSLFKFLFGEKQLKPNDPVEHKDKFSVVHFPRTERYYAKCNDKWLKQSHYTGIVFLEDKLDYASHGNTERYAERLIELYKEQRHFSGVVVISK